MKLDYFKIVSRGLKRFTTRVSLMALTKRVDLGQPTSDTCQLGYIILVLAHGRVSDPIGKCHFLANMGVGVGWGGMLTFMLR